MELLIGNANHFAIPDSTINSGESKKNRNFYVFDVSLADASFPICHQPKLFHISNWWTEKCHFSRPDKCIESGLWWLSTAPAIWMSQQRGNEQWKRTNLWLRISLPSPFPTSLATMMAICVNVWRCIIHLLLCGSLWLPYYQLWAESGLSRIEIE